MRDTPPETRPNAEVVNDEAKLLMHLIVVRAVRRDPSLMDDAGRSMDVIAERFPDGRFVPEWRRILGLPTDEVLRLLAERSERMTMLRLSSPFMTIPRIGLQDVDLRRRIWRKARRLVVARSENVGCEARPTLAA